MDIQQFEMAGLGKYAASQQVDEMAMILEHSDEQELWVLEFIAAAQEELERQRDLWGNKARAAGFSFTAIGAALGVSKQAAAKKYGTKD